MVQPRRALLSVTDKSGIVELARELVQMGVEVLSTGGTASLLEENGVTVNQVSSETGFPEILGGRVKTLHPRIHGGILYRRGHEGDEEDVSRHGLRGLDLVAVNLYDFSGRTAGGVTDDEAMEAVDIGGPTMIRAAAKNWRHVIVLTSPEQYEDVLGEWKEKGGVSDETRRSLAAAAFEATARYDRMIADWFASGAAQDEGLPARLDIGLKKKQGMRYGENPHQRASFYVVTGEEGRGVAAGLQLHGKALSFNNVIDADIALTMPYEFDQPAVAILKHTTPSGVGIGATLADAEAKARACDPLSAFGGIVGMNRVCDEQTAAQINKAFTEVVVAPGFDEAALEILKKKKNIRLLEVDPDAVQTAGFDVRRVLGGMLVQDRDAGFPELDDWKVVTKTQPTEDQLRDLGFAWKVCKYVKSNAILFARDGATLGIGAGQMSRVDAVRIARMKATDVEIDLSGSVVASDAFFPFADGMLQCVEAGATAVIQPGGSVRDQEVIDAADEAGIAMLFTGRRHFRHS
ncbi:bifunctional phosphoribosylaminoimidazolecarboxamide formyltransferase/IMP cyclohydrolase [bacterium]|nr:bifunctional phosphoribosylaminoimidazolecarboxamide formyltransferase/IMP cyclohydrolase [bacterium]